MNNFDPLCCHFMDFDGWGSNCFCCGGICFVSDVVKEWSDMRNKNQAANDDYVVVHDDHKEKVNDEGQ